MNQSELDQFDKELVALRRNSFRFLSKIIQDLHEAMLYIENDKQALGAWRMKQAYDELGKMIPLTIKGEK